VSDVNLRDILTPAPLLWAGADGEAKKDRAFAEVKRRYLALVAWGVEQKAPEAREHVEALRAFVDRWESFLGARDAQALRTAASDLAAAESHAQDHGYSSADVPARPAPQGGAPVAPLPTVQTPEPDATDHPLALAVDQAAPSLPGAPRSGSGPQTFGPTADPYFAPKVAGLAALGLATLAGSLAAKRESVRVGVAAGGSILTLGAALAAFWPTTTPKKEKT
jgi:hypothetical protein